MTTGPSVTAARRRIHHIDGDVDVVRRGSLIGYCFDALTKELRIAAASDVEDSSGERHGIERRCCARTLWILASRLSHTAQQETVRGH